MNPNFWFLFRTYVGYLDGLWLGCALILLLPVGSLVSCGFRGAVKATLVVGLSLIGPVAMLAMEAARPGSAMSHDWLVPLLQTTAAVLPFVFVVRLTRRDRPYLASWAVPLFYIGAIGITALTWFITGMALSGDWI